MGQAQRSSRGISSALQERLSQPHQHPQPVFHRRHCRRQHAAPAGDDAVLADGADGFAKKRGGIGEAAFGWLDDDVEGDASQRGRDGNHDHEISPALIEGINGNDEDGATSGLLMAANGIQISEPNVASRGRGCGGHGSGSVGLEAVGTGAVEVVDLPAVIIGCRWVGGEGFISGCSLGKKTVATISLQGGIENDGHAGVGVTSELSEKAAACI
jgi:hypothetical protein